MGNEGKESDFYCMKKKFFFTLCLYLCKTKVSQKRNHVNFTK